MTDFSGYFNQFHQNIYGAPPPSAESMNGMMVQAGSTAQVQQGQQQGGQEKGPVSQAADIYSKYDKAKNMYNSLTATSSTPVASSASGGAAFGEGAGVYPVATEGSAGLWGGADMGASTMTGFTPAAGSTGAAGGTAAGASTSAGTTAGSAGTGAGYSALGLYGLIAGLGANAVNRDWYTPKDIVTGAAPAERWENMDALQNFSGEADNLIGGSGGIFEDSSRIASIDPRESWAGHKDLTGDVVEMSKSIADQNINGAKQFSNTTLVEPAKKTLDFTKKTLNPFKWFD